MKCVVEELVKSGQKSCLDNLSKDSGSGGHSLSSSWRSACRSYFIGHSLNGIEAVIHMVLPRLCESYGARGNTFRLTLSGRVL